ncbi:PilZ domain-containing protein [Novosphingobium sp. Chol11]|uniref:PilZ domain-containing protein n=1 Tax=Novosphingobium sp. Chol11 TaxID=1385763 RepID=UPI0025D4A36D|nr:PilZ domain-containing protein [Novosphingobium sp. Chol11]
MAQRDELSGAYQPAERSETTGAHLRTAQRYALLIRAAKLVTGDQEFPCIIRDASSTGVKARLFSPLPAQSDLAIELANGDRYPAELVWTSDDHVGLRFVDQIAIERLLEETHTPFRKRPLRLKLALGAVLHSAGEAVGAGFRNISQQGASIECEKWLLVDELVRLETGLTPPIYAKVRWRNHPFYGLVFEQTFKLDELARVSGSAQSAHEAQTRSELPAETSLNSR